MDKSIIEEIVNQLGIAVDQAGQFITTYLPDYAALKVIQLSAPINIFAVVFVVSLILTVIAYFVSGYGSDMFAVFFFFCFISGVVFVGLMVSNCANIQGWQNYPEAMLIDMALSRIGG